MIVAMLLLSRYPLIWLREQSCLKMTVSGGANQENLFSIEEYLDVCAKADTKELAKQLVEGTLPRWTHTIEASERSLLRTLLDRYLAVYEKPTARWIQRLDRSRGKDLATKLYLQGSEGSVDLSLLALRCALKQSEE